MEKAGAMFGSDSLASKGTQKRSDAGAGGSDSYGDSGSSNY